MESREVPSSGNDVPGMSWRFGDLVVRLMQRSRSSAHYTPTKRFYCATRGSTESSAVGNTSGACLVTALALEAGCPLHLLFTFTSAHSAVIPVRNARVALRHSLSLTLCVDLDAFSVTKGAPPTSFFNLLGARVLALKLRSQTFEWPPRKKLPRKKLYRQETRSFGFRKNGSTIEWAEWKQLVRELLERHDPNQVHPRFLHAELRLSRINTIHRFTRRTL
ncbi:hypothetical protein GGTG_13267 [Gaeumannomyces tritici R3-111a-1]|uniref:Uncharacterized protein n=1 Tax=Gaeumannomyces tritici (strain R3-111a-1) TaxID=644352 RepID=J3PID9_GAET3|nr:hypothetical protein GGTG_13267 [Gaeumannomyces tritici R3-111a-1]EJT69158.1 hypothetical protein GGTG_13267 [Gaeumannomyces tritici R3-111a-1]